MRKPQAIVGVGALLVVALLVQGGMNLASAQVLGGGGGCEGDCTMESLTLTSDVNPIIVPQNGEICLNATCTAILEYKSSNSTAQFTNAGRTVSLGMSLGTGNSSASHQFTAASLVSSSTIKAASTATRGTVTLSGGAGSVTVLSGAYCVCSSTNSLNPAQCAVTSTTLNITGTGTDVIAYVCL